MEDAIYAMLNWLNKIKEVTKFPLILYIFHTQKFFESGILVPVFSNYENAIFSGRNVYLLDNGLFALKQIQLRFKLKALSLSQN